MQNFQSKVLERLELIAVKRELEPTIVYSFANDGKVLGMCGFETAATAHFRFNNGHNTISFDAPWFQAQQGNMFLFKEEDGAKISQMLLRWTELLDAYLEMREVEFSE